MKADIQLTHIFKVNKPFFTQMEAISQLWSNSSELKNITPEGK